MPTLSFAYYCSGHGYGHATRVSAFTSHLRSLESPPAVYIISSAPEHVFADCLALGAHYRYAEIDPVISQPLAYRVDRQKSVDVLEVFLHLKDVKLAQEALWLVDNEIDCVLSDTAFLGCLAAHRAHLPSVLITNFSFDPVYSYLSTPLFDQSQDTSTGTLTMPELTATPELHAHVISQLAPDMPIMPEVLAPLVTQLHAGFKCADLLLLLPGAIPIPSFAMTPALPSPDWIDPETLTFRADVVEHLTRLLEHPDLELTLPSVPFPPIKPVNVSRALANPACPRPRTVRLAPLLVRPHSASPSASPYTPSGRAKLLASLGVPSTLHNPEHTKLLVVSFGGQTFKPPRSGSRTPRTPSHSRSPSGVNTHAPSLSPLAINTHEPRDGDWRGSVDVELRLWRQPKRLASGSHIFIPGAPPARSVPTSPVVTTGPAFHTIPPTPDPNTILPAFPGQLSLSSSGASFAAGGDISVDEPQEMREPRLLPDESWIAVVCGAPADWGRDEDEGLPDGFYVAPRDVYMPDLTAAADVLLGKLGYGTVSECVDAATPCVYVARPLFIEEHGLRLLLAREGVGVELARRAYEEGDWADAVEEAYERGREGKKRKRVAEIRGAGMELHGGTEGGANGVQDGVLMSGARKRAEEGREMAQGLVEWVEGWWQAASGIPAS